VLTIDSISQHSLRHLNRVCGRLLTGGIYLDNGIGLFTELHKGARLFPAMKSEVPIEGRTSEVVESVTLTQERTRSEKRRRPPRYRPLLNRVVLKLASEFEAVFQPTLRSSQSEGTTVPMAYPDDGSRWIDIFLP
jgi:hypothetical protein